MARETGLTSGTKTTGHGAACLGADAHGGAVGVDHENCFNATSAVELPQELDRGVVIRNDFFNQGQRVGQQVNKLRT